jgi:translation initiation factor RLI1
VNPSEENGMKRFVLVVEHDLAVLDYLSGISLALSCSRMPLTYVSSTSL